MVGFVGQPVRIGKVSLSQVQLECPLIHGFHEKANTRPKQLVFLFGRTLAHKLELFGKILGETHRSVISAREHQTVQQVIDGHSLTLNQICGGPNRPRSLVAHAKVRGVNVEVQFSAEIQADERGHHFGQTGHLTDLLVILVHDEFVGFCVGDRIRFAADVGRVVRTCHILVIVHEGAI